MEPIDNVQSKQLAKAYLFLRTFVPRVLTGCFGHIRGNDVMDHVLCTNEHTFSRHKLAKQVTAAFRKLEKWMSGCDVWTAAVKRAREGDRTGRRDLNRKAPGLFSPAAIMAVLIVAYPDPDNQFHNLIGRLQIDWMVLQDHSELSIQHGFWKGMTSHDLGNVFINNNADEDWTAIVEMLVDYDRILGLDFSACRKDMRPYLPEQFKAKVNLSNELSGIEDEIGPGEEIEGDAQSIEPVKGHADSTVVEETDHTRIVDEPGDLRAGTLLERDNTDPLEDTQPLVQTLSLRNHLNTDDSKLLEKQKPVLRAWCQHWERKIEQVSNARDQHIVRSLFMQSLCRLKNLSAASDTQANAFMLVCIAESESQPSGEEQTDDTSLFEAAPPCAAFSEAREEFRRMANNTGAPITLLEENFADQLMILRHFMQESPFSDYWPDLLHLEALYTRLLVLGYEDPVMDPETVTFLRHERNNILNETNRELLRLDSWQTRAMLLPGGLNVLTGYQQQLFRETYCQGQETPTLDLSKMPLMSISPSFIYPDAVEQEYPSLSKLLGILQMPCHNTHQPNTFCAPIPAASSRTSQSMSPTRQTHMTPSFAAEGGTTAKRLLPFGTAGRTAKMARTVHNNTGSPQRNMNTVSGQEVTPLGACPPRAIRTPALPRTVGALSVITPENLRQELQSALHGVHERYTAHAAQTTEGVMNKIKTLEDKIVEGFNRLDLALKKADVHHSMLRKDISTMLNHYADGSGRDLTKFTAQVHADINEVKDGLQVQTDILNGMNARPKTPQLPPSPQPGQAGFLAQYPAPLGASQDAYERTLLRAAWYYLNCLGNPDQSAWADEAAWTAAMNAFPNLEADHLQGALDHVHVQAYGCSLPRLS